MIDGIKNSYQYRVVLSDDLVDGTVPDESPEEIQHDDDKIEPDYSWDSE